MILKSFCAVIFAILILPSLVVVYGSFTASGYASVIVQHFTLHWYHVFLSDDQFMISTLISLQVAVATAFFSGVIGTFVAVCMARYNFWGKAALEAVFTLPLMIPAVVLALAFLLFYTWLGIAGGITAIVIGHTIMTTPYVVRLVRSNFANYNWSLDRAAANLGASPPRVFFHVTMPLIAPGIIGGMALSFIVSFDDAVVALFLSGPEVVTLPVRIFNYLSESPGPIVGAAGSALVFFSLVTMFLMEAVVGTRTALNVEAAG
jgi:putative spermidine/putrescine transport system permease protein